MHNAPSQTGIVKSKRSQNWIGEGKITPAKWLRIISLGLAFLLSVGYAGIWSGTKSKFGSVPLDFMGLWDGGAGPRLNPTLLGVQELRWGGTIEEEDGNAAYQLGGRKAMYLGKWQLPSSSGSVSFGAWVKVQGELAGTNLVQVAGTPQKAGWGIGILNGRAAGWLCQFEPQSNRLVSSFILAGQEEFPVNRWVYLALVAERGQCSLWMDGRRVAKVGSEYAHPNSPNVWLGNAPERFITAESEVTIEKQEMGARLLVDDFVVYERGLGEAEMKAMVKGGRGGIVRAHIWQERSDWLQGAAGWIIAIIGVLCGVAFMERVRALLSAGLKPAFASMWLVFIVGGAITIWVGVRLAAKGKQADRERLDLFADQLVNAGENYFERVADLLRRARDVVRAKPEITSNELRRWAMENGLPHDFTALEGIGWARKETRGGDDWALPLKAYARSGVAGPLPEGGNARDWLEWVENSSPIKITRERLTEKNDVASTGLTTLRPFEEGNEAARGMQLYIPVYRVPSPVKAQLPSQFEGVVFASIRLAEIMESYWKGLPPLIGGRFITGTINFREDVAVSSEEMFPETRRPAKPYLEKETAIRIYTRRLWVQLWTTPAFARHSPNRSAWFAAAAGFCLTGLAGTLVGLQTRSRLKQEQVAAELQEARDTLQAVQRAREGLSRDLHDGAIQSLYAIQLHLGRVAERMKSDKRVEAELNTTRAGVDAIIAELREFTVTEDEEYSAPPKAELSQVLETLVNRVRPVSTAVLSVSCDGGAANALTARQAVQLANIAREGLSNALRHGAPNKVEIILKRSEKGEIVLEIIDDGTGFSPENPPQAGLGLASIRSRASEAGGNALIESTPGKGTRLVITIDGASPGENGKESDG